MIASFARNSTAHLQNGTLVNTNLPRFEAGRFAQAVMVEEGTTNLLTANQSSVEDGTTTGFFFLGTAVLSSVTTDKWQGNNCIQAVLPGLHSFTEGLVVGGVSGSAGTIFTGSLYFKAPQGISFQILLRREFTFDFTSIILVSTGVWQRVNLQHTLGATTTNLNLTIRTVNAQAITFWVDGLQIEQRAYATSWQLGGTPRAAETLTIPTAGILSPAEGTIEFWWQPINQPASNMTTQFASPQIMRMGTYNNGNSWVLWNWDGALSLFVRGAGHTSWTGVWHVISGSVWHQLNRWYHISVRWSGANTFWVFVDGVRHGPYVSTHPFTGVAGNVMALGGAAASGGANAFIDDLRISNRARTDQEIADAFASNQPLPVDASTTYLMRMDGNLTHGQGGDYVSPEYDLSTVGTGITSAVNWQAPADGVTREVAARLDGQAWTPVTNGGPLPFTPGQLLTGRRAQLRTTLRRG